MRVTPPLTRKPTFLGTGTQFSTTQYRAFDSAPLAKACVRGDGYLTTPLAINAPVVVRCSHCGSG